MQDRRDAGKGYRTGGTQERMDAGKDGCRKGGMKDRRDAEKGGMQDRRDAVKEECRKGGMQERRVQRIRNEGKEGYRTGRIQNWGDT